MEPLSAWDLLYFLALLYAFAAALVHALRSRGEARGLGLVIAVFLVPALFYLKLRGGWDAGSDSGRWFIITVTGEGGKAAGTLDLVKASIVFSLLYCASTLLILALGAWYNRTHRTHLHALHRSLIKLVFVSTGVVVYLKALGFSLTPLLFGMGAASIVVGFALQEPLSNLFAGLSLDFEGTVGTGDWIMVDDQGKTVGKVIDKGWRTTRLLTIDNEAVVLPNRLLGGQKIVNYHKPDRKHVHKLRISASCSEPPVKVKEVLRSVLCSCRHVLGEPEPTVRTVLYGESSIEYEIRFYLDDYGVHLAACDEIMTSIWYALRENSIEIPFPVRTLQIKPEARLRQVKEESERSVSELKDFLRGLCFLSNHLSSSDFEFVALNSTFLHFEGKEAVILKGSSGDAFYIVKEGMCEVRMPQGEVKILLPGEYFGEMALLRRGPRNADVTAGEGGARIVRIDRECMQKLFDSHPGLFLEVTRTDGARRNESGIEDTGFKQRRSSGLTRFSSFALRTLFPWR